MLADWNNSSRIDMSFHSDTLSWFWANQSLLFLFVLSWKATNTNFKVIGLTQPGLEHRIYHTQVEQANHYTTDSSIWKDTFIKWNILKYV